MIWQYRQRIDCRKFHFFNLKNKDAPFINTILPSCKSFSTMHNSQRQCKHVIVTTALMGAIEGNLIMLLCLVHSLEGHTRGGGGDCSEEER